MTAISSVLLERFDESPMEELLVGNKACARPSWKAQEVSLATRQIAAGLIQLHVPQGSHIGLIADNCDHWLISDLGSLHCGLVNVPRAKDTSTEEIGFVLEHSGCTATFLEDPTLLERIREQLAELSNLSLIILMKGECPDLGIPGKTIMNLQGLMDLGKAAEIETPGLGDSRQGSVQDGDLATIVYTSGTTGNPKGVRLTHGNILHNIRTIPQVLDLVAGDRYLSFLPTWHSFERAMEYCLLNSGTTIYYSSKSRLRKDMPRVKPTILAGVPRLWESLASSVLGSVEKLPTGKKKLIQFLLKGSEKCVHARRLIGGQMVNDRNGICKAKGLGTLSAQLSSIIWAPCHMLADRLVYSKLRTALGGAVRFIVSGGGALQAHVDEFFNRAGICLLNGYGLTETAPVISIRTPQDNVLTTAGKKLPETTWRIRNEENTETLDQGQKGVLWVQGPQVMDGYHRNPDATKMVLADGWFCTGDVASLTDHDQVLIQGRAKDTIVLRGGENVEPALIEAPIAKIPYVHDVLVVGHGEKHLSALIIPELETLQARFPDLPAGNLKEIAQDPRVSETIHQSIKDALARSAGFQAFQQVPKIALLDRLFSVEDGTLTLTMKKKRPQIESIHADTIAQFYQD